MVIYGFIIHQIFSLARDWFKRVRRLNISQLKLRNIRVIPGFQIRVRYFVTFRKLRASRVTSKTSSVIQLMEHSQSMRRIFSEIRRKYDGNLMGNRTVSNIFGNPLFGMSGSVEARAEYLRKFDLTSFD